jgi:hypothetical protein
MSSKAPWAVGAAHRAAWIRGDTIRVVNRSREALERSRKLLDQADRIERQSRDLLAMAVALDRTPAPLWRHGHIFQAPRVTPVFHPPWVPKV